MAISTFDYVAVFNAIPVPAIVIDTEGIIRDVNQAFLHFARRRHGHEILKEDRIGHLITAFVETEDECGRWEAFIREVLSIEEEQRFPMWKSVDASGHVCYSDICAKVIKDEAGGVVGALILQKEVTEEVWQRCTRELLESNHELEQAKKALQRAEEKYRSIFENAIEGIFQITPDGHFITANPALVRMYGYKSPEELMTSLTDIERQLYVDPNRRAEFVRILEECGTVQGFESQIYRKDGRMIWISENSLAVHDASGRLLYYEGTVEDITNQKRMKAVLRHTKNALRESEIYSKNIIDSSLDMIIAVDMDRNITMFNKAAQDTFGYHPGEVIGQHVNLLYADPEEGHIVHTMTVEQGRCVREVLNRRKNGEVFPSLLAASVLRNAHSEMVGVMGVSRDITEQKQLEAEFLQAQKMESLGRLAGGIAHDFNNILTVILGSVDLMIQDLPSVSPEISDLQEIREVAKRAANLVRQLLTFARRQTVEPRDINLNDLLVSLDKMLHRFIGEDIELEFIRAPDLGRVMGDPGQLEQVLVNLAVNARDAMPNGGRLTIEAATVTLGLEDVRQHIEVMPGEYVLIVVQDTGCGMSKEVQMHCFEPFFTTKAPDKGTGLGLAASYGIVKQHGGHIEVESEPGKGTTFRIHLPRVEDVENAVSLKDDVGIPMRGAEVVLVVEDELKVRTMVARVLRTQGYTVLEAATADEALHLTQKHDREPIHLLV
ncbi:MAG: PAS domain S-box protein, partial [Candidatus Latescibacteria bacterium]|nr:PAS domain S-box protein [Candidatus Latescibacterota bacterium]